MSVSQALENSARNFSDKYACQFDFATFESRVEEFTFLRPNGGWIDVYKMVFERLYKLSLEKVAAGVMDNLDGEAMLDDFEYTLIRPYVNECDEDIKHKPYVGMDRMARLAFLDRLTREAPSNLVDLYIEKYKSGEITIGNMRNQVRLAFAFEKIDRAQFIEIAGYIQALEKANEGRSLMWRTLHPFRNNAEKRDAAFMKRALVDKAEDGEAFYNDAAAAACETFDGHTRVNANLAQSIIRAKEEMRRNQRMNDAIRESLRT